MIEDCPFCGCAGISAAYPRIIHEQACGVVECHTDNCYAMVVADTLPQAITAWNRRAAIAPDARLPTDAMIEAGAKQMRAVLDDGGWDDITIFLSALEAAGIGAPDARLREAEEKLRLFPEAYDVLTRQEMRDAKGNWRSLIDQQTRALADLRALIEALSLPLNKETERG